MDLERLVEKARQSTLFTAPVLGPDLERFLKEEGEHIKQLAHRAVESKVSHIYWVGCGNSWVNLWSGKYLLDRFTTLNSDVYTAYDFIWRNPRQLDENAWVFLASFSGATEDTLAALRFAKSRGAHTISLVNKGDSLMGKEADEFIEYRSKALYLLPLAAAYLFALEAACLQGSAEAEEVIQGMYALPSLLSEQYVAEEAKAKQRAEEFKAESLFYCMSSGPLWGIGYKFGLTVFMENMRVHGSFIEATEFRHGPAEMLERAHPAVVLLKGTDESRPLVERVQRFLEVNQAHLLVFDMADYPGVHPLLSPFVLMIPLQWFAVYSSLMRGIEDLDARVFMGHGVMAQGSGVTWP